MLLDYIQEFKSYREQLEISPKRKISPNTIEMEVRYLRKFHSFLNVLHKEQVPVWEINFTDVKTFFDVESENLSNRTLYRKVTILTLYFDYLWKHNHIPIDFMAKFRQRYRDLKDWKEPEVQVNYQVMLDKKDEILENPTIHLMPKLIFLLLLRGVPLADMLRIEIHDISIQSSKALIIYETKKDKIERTLEYESDIEIEIIKDGIDLAENRGVSYFLSSKSKKEGGYTTFNPVNLHDMVKPIENLLGFSITSTTRVMYAYVHFLATIKKKNVDELSYLLGMTVPYTVKVLNTALERISKNTYNENIK